MRTAIDCAYTAQITCVFNEILTSVFTQDTYYEDIIMAVVLFLFFLSFFHE